MTSRTKREFLVVSVAGLVAGSLAPGALLAGQAPLTGKFTTDGFRALINTPFSIGVGPVHKGALALVAVADGPSSPHTEQFTITLKAGARLSVMTEGLYEVTHPDLGRFQLHMQPVQTDATGTSYRSAFSLIRPGLRAG